MAGIFEVFVDGESFFRFRLKSPDGVVIAVSAPFEDKHAVVAGIAAARECAGMGLVTDLCPAASVRESTATVRPSAIPQSTVPHGAIPQTCEEPRKTGDGFRTRARELRRAATAPRWTGAA
ncbi:YegP family protein [Arthrobacter sp. B2a2-09]|uniref:YegP family protein n=1 Tax=Arthrobacter sp. B2a2-09 TaxID=2952822 RepID=UPI0022CD7D64|nr:YegP family protein [Arthrobacter sp. B2a2-09]MCZ9884412.1 YegP family protein [Arthrobacter sp. B2a2-09]